MDSVFILWHSHENYGEIDSKLIGVYRTHDDALAAQRRVQDKPGFRNAIDGFEIQEYILGRDGWIEGYIPASEANLSA